MNNFEWTIYSRDKKDLLEIVKDMRGFSDDVMKAFLENNYKPLPPSSLPNIEKAKAVLMDVIHNNGKIRVMGDYDCDGITATATMVIGLKLLTPLVDYDIPYREDGYGLSRDMVDRAIHDKINLIITVDNGITCHDAVKYAQQNGIKVIVTDHHEHVMNTLPCEITVDPMLLKGTVFRNICGCYVAFKFLQYVIEDFRVKYNDVYRQLAFLSVISTIGDSMPLFNENRTFIARLLPNLRNWDLGYGIEALIKALKSFD